MSGPDTLLTILQNCVDDPMWADHVEMPKRILRIVIERLRNGAQASAVPEDQGRLADWLLHMQGTFKFLENDPIVQEHIAFLRRSEAWIRGLSISSTQNSPPLLRASQNTAERDPSVMSGCGGGETHSSADGKSP